jgi:putative ABC transport system permease protein
MPGVRGAAVSSVSPGFFRTMSIPLIRGREFVDADSSATLPVVIVSQATARRFWGDGDPLGRTLHRQGDSRQLTVVGVVGDVRHTALNQESPAIYYASTGRVPVMDVVVRTEARPESVLSTVRQRVHELDPALPVSTVRTMDEWVSRNAAQPRLNAILLAVFAAVAMLIAAIGIGVGIAGALAFSRALATLVFDVPVRDPVTYAAVATALTLVALAACVIPASKSSRVDPMVALRCD